MATSEETAGRTAVVCDRRDVRLPVEVLWMIVETLAASSEQFELMYLRKVNSMLLNAFTEDFAEPTDVYSDL